jgi:hypothetical protein
MDECDFIQCKVYEYESEDEFMRDTHPKIPGLSRKTNLEKSCLIQLLPRNLISDEDKQDQCLYAAKPIHPPEMHMSSSDLKKWVADTVINFHQNKLYEEYVIDRVIYYRLEQVTCNLIKADTAWFESQIPKLKQFWDYVDFYRKNSKKLDKFLEFLKDYKYKDSAAIFEYINRDYLSVNLKSKYKPLYQQRSSWRQYYDEQYKKKYTRDDDKVNIKNVFFVDD